MKKAVRESLVSMVTAPAGGVFGVLSHLLLMIGFINIRTMQEERRRVEFGESVKHLWAEAEELRTTFKGLLWGVKNWPGLVRLALVHKWDT